MCDLLEVYSSSEKETLKRTHGVYMKESELARSIAATVVSEESFQFVDTDTLRYQKIVSQKVETIRLKAEQRTTNNNIIDQSAFYSDIESDDDDHDDDDDARDKNNKNNKSEIESEEEEEEDDTESGEDEEHKKWNKNKRAPNVYKEEIDVDDI